MSRDPNSPPETEAVPPHKKVGQAKRAHENSKDRKADALRANLLRRKAAQQAQTEDED